MKKNELTDLLAFDPLAAAEQLTGESYTNDEPTMALGMVLLMDSNAAKDRALRAADDSYFAQSLPDFLSLLNRMGFTEVLCDHFVGSYQDDETYRILWHPTGILATVESYEGTRRINSSKIYYNLRTPDGHLPDWRVTSSGGICKGVWVGDHDIREGARVKIENLAEAGEFLPVWVSSPFLRFVTYAEGHVKGYDYNALTAERISRLPQNIREAIAGKDYL